ncbi:hypothetical protein NK8_35790 [Caballeronia sp. NK8]|nr:hypothetical protein NK8_35790 [Caballeronia sp. NK8]
MRRADRRAGKSYVYKKLRATSTAGVAYADEPEKGCTSHVVEAFQYLCTHVARVAVDDEGDTVACRGGSGNGGWCDE